MMDDSDDDFYDPADTVPVSHHQNGAQNAPAGNMQEDYEEEEIEVDEDDDDFNIITEAPADAPAPEAPHPRHANLRAESQRPSSAESPPAPKPATPSLTPKVESATPVPLSARPPAPQKPGSAYPPVHASTIDVHANPVHPTTGKPILLTDMDADFPEDDKPWRRPGSDITDYFNYGFDEFTWASYVLKQQELRKEIGDQKRQLDDMQAFLGMGMPPMAGGPPGPGVPPSTAAPPMPGMPGMPDMSPEMMQGILTSMMSQGLDPASMDPMTFMQHAQALMGGQPGAGGGQQGQPGFGGQGGGQPQMGYGGGFGGGGRGRGRRWYNGLGFGVQKISFLRNVKNLAPLLDRVLVQRVKPEAKTASGIFLPESSVKEQNEAKVLAVGPGAVDRNGQRIPMGVAVGDRVLIPQFGGSPIKVGEEEYTLYRDSEILAKINE
ncbi:cleavage polyadenylation factor subunit FIP1 [Aspergillus saccharolyticus JOP 1030-1]|uniref:Cpn10-domain-containing protein n=1 Tax=Aspergillus saccharolyticus JOP 1030-1 TaxID=1450539 RepID=A0A319A4D9_9EURO|nr:Cpn10-domain-containing protein [Aspergillus saccharolyticus JOP 1030-1]PYH42302.1 Cpn10-domain-containing protein [Aspergillus saccharolyticus JOP 1030-1]